MAESPFSETRVLGILLLAILLNTYLFGVISQQIYSYWTCGFKDSRRLITFIVALFVIVALQSSLLWVMAWNVYIVRSVHTASKVATWEGPANAVCQCILILSANIFLAARIHKLTSSRLQSRLVITLSISAFVIRLVNLVTTWISKKYLSPQTQYTVSQRTMSVVWHTIQAVCECLIMSSLSRVLLSSRSGLQKSDRIVNHLIRNVIKNGLFATLWSIAGLATYFLLPDWAIFVIFDMTSGSIYTHMIYDTLLSRTRLRERMAERSNLEMVLPTLNSLALEGKGMHVSGVAGVPHSVVTMGNFRFTQNESSATGTTHNDNSELECAPVGKTAPGYEFPYNADPGE